MPTLHMAANQHKFNENYYTIRLRRKVVIASVRHARDVSAIYWRIELLYLLAMTTIKI